MKLESIGQKIRYYRQIRKLTQNDLAEKLGLRWEMVSRYERGVTSPLSRIDEISEALSVSVAELLQDSNNANVIGEVGGARLPLFITPPSRLDFTKQSSTYFYSAPEWILNIDRKSFVIDPQIATIKVTRVASAGPIYVSPGTKPESNDLVLYKYEGKLFIDKSENLPAKGKVIGTILAQENRLR